MYKTSIKTVYDTFCIFSGILLLFSPSWRVYIKDTLLAKSAQQLRAVSLDSIHALSSVMIFLDLVRVLQTKLELLEDICWKRFSNLTLVNIFAAHPML